MGYEWSIVNDADKSSFDLGKGAWSGLDVRADEEVWTRTVWDVTEYWTFGDLAEIDVERAAYTLALVERIREFIGDTPLHHFEVVGESDDRVYQYEQAGDRYMSAAEYNDRIPRGTARDFAAKMLLTGNT